jgi:uncharacterized cupredoxin-like copper-binding protein
MSVRIPAALAAFALVLALPGVALARPSAMHKTTVRVMAKEYSFKLSRKTVPAGKVTFMIKNAGRLSHNFTIAGHKSKTIGPGKTTTLVVTLKKGTYPYKCSVDSHAKFGMKGVLRVT